MNKVVPQTLEEEEEEEKRTGGNMSKVLALSIFQLDPHTPEVEELPRMTFRSLNTEEKKRKMSKFISENPS